MSAREEILKLMEEEKEERRAKYREANKKYMSTGTLKELEEKKRKKAEYHWKDRDKYLKMQRDRHLTNKLKAIEYLGGKCKRCDGVFPHYIYDLHHRNPNEKDSKVGLLLRNSWSTAVIEVDKCDLLCAHCHRIIHNEDNDPYWNKSRHKDTEN